MTQALSYLLRPILTTHCSHTKRLLSLPSTPQLTSLDRMLTKIHRKNDSKKAKCISRLGLN